MRMTMPAQDRRWTWVLLTSWILACAGSPSNQKSFLVETRGLSSYAFNIGKSHIAVCGESANYKSPGSSSAKDGFIWIRDLAGSAGTGISFSNGQSDSRIERVLPTSGGYVLAGFTGPDRDHLLVYADTDWTVRWSKTAAGQRSTDLPVLTVGADGSILHASRPTGGEAFLTDLHLTDPAGKLRWTRRIPSVETMQGLIASSRGDFLVSYKQKGAYLDGQTRKRYLMNSFQRFDLSGKVVQSIRFLFDDDQVQNAVFGDVAELPGGKLLFAGKLVLAAGSEYAFALLSQPDGKILWSNIYTGLQNYHFKRIAIDAEGKFLLLADAYGKQGGMALLRLAPDGSAEEVKTWKASSYEQAAGLLLTGEGSCIAVWDRLFAIAGAVFDPRFRACVNGMESLEAKPQHLNVLQEAFRDRVEELPIQEWTDAGVRSERLSGIPEKSLCP